MVLLFHYCLKGAVKVVVVTLSVLNLTLLLFRTLASLGRFANEKNYAGAWFGGE